MVELKPIPGAKKRRKRVGRGISAGQGKTCGRGQKGQKAREKVAQGFEGGQTPLHRRLRQLRGQSSRAMNIGMFRKEWSVINVGQLNSFDDGTTVTPELLLKEGFVRKLGDGLKILGSGELKAKLTVRANAFSATAREKILAAGGQVEVV